MPTAAERAAFMQMMGISAADVAEPVTTSSPTGSRPHGGASAGAGVGVASRPLAPASGAGSKLYRPSYTESVSSSVGLSMSSVGSSTQPTAEKRRAFLAELGIPDASLEEPRAAGHTTATAGRGPARGLSASNHSNTNPNSEPSSTRLGGGPPPVPRRQLSGSSASTQSADDLKTAGNAAFEQGLFSKAARFYTLAIDALQSEATAPHGGTMDSFLNGGASAAGGASHTVQLAALYSNRSAAYLQGAKQCESVDDALEHALYDAEQAVALRGDWFKGYSREGDVYFKMQRYEQAADAFQMALHLEPGNSNIASSLDESRERARLQYRRGRGGGRTGGQSDANGTTADNDTFPLGSTAPTVPTSELYTSPGASNPNTPLGPGAPASHGGASALPIPVTGSTPGSARMAYGLYDHGLPKASAYGGSSSQTRTAGTTPDRGTSATYSSGLGRKSSFDAYYGGDHSDVRQEWDRLKHEVETTTHDATGDDYRKRQLEKYRMERSSGQKSEGRSFASLRATFQSNPLVSGSASQTSEHREGAADSAASSPSNAETGARRTPYFASNTRGAPPPPRRASVDSDGEKHLSTLDIPAEFSSAAASTYQQKLLEEYRRRKEKNNQ